MCAGNPMASVYERKVASVTRETQHDVSLTSTSIEELAGDEMTGDVMTLLGRGIPLTLLLDLLDPRGPASEQILRTEGMSVA